VADSSYISSFQREVARAFFAMPESRRFLLAGGAALIAAGVVERVTDDLDFFAPRSRADVPAAKVAFERVCDERGWAVQVVIDSAEFVRLVVTSGDEELAVDFGVDADPLLPPTTTFLGPSISVEENTGRKTLALFGRWLPRDFVDVYALAERYGKPRLLELAAERDAGFDLGFFAQALDQVTTIRPERFPIAPERVAEMLAFFTGWAAEIRAHLRSHHPDRG
jgi:hypothetical protein